MNSPVEKPFLSTIPAYTIQDAWECGAQSARNWCDSAKLSLAVSVDQAAVPLSYSTWRTVCVAEFVHAISHQENLQQVLHSWEIGFDSELAGSTAQTHATPQITPVSELIRNVLDALLRIVGTASSIRCIAEDMPVTPLENDDQFCPELAFPLLAQGVLTHAKKALSSLDELESLVAWPSRSI